ncbi:hypothetical protein [Sinorhizobium fredii]|uniref:hypothetical protein n=1 Tax=Rhizobium fredii TaxID=380 RepID=UPI00210B2CA8|nr:hypothetical protein [Sinorhizobium fredii]UTY46697.1 hypothetical protein EPK84_07485 [Sinorhizobium fredii]
MTQKLDTSTVHHALSLLKAPVRSSSAGSARARNERLNAEAIASHVVTYLRRQWRFRRGGHLVDDRVVVGHLADVIRSIPQSVTQDHSATDDIKRDAARQFIANELFEAVSEEFQPVHTAVPYSAVGGSCISRR